MRLLKLTIFLLTGLFFSSCGGYMIEAGLSSDSGTLERSKGAGKGGGIGASVGIRYKKMLHESKTEIGTNGFGVDLMHHLNGYGSNRDSEVFTYTSLTGRYYYLLNPNKPVKVYLTGNLGFAQKRSGRENRTYSVFGTSIDIHFFKREFIYVSQRVNLVSGLNGNGNSLSMEFAVGMMLRWKK